MGGSQPHASSAVDTSANLKQSPTRQPLCANKIQILLNETVINIHFKGLSSIQFVLISDIFKKNVVFTIT